MASQILPTPNGAKPQKRPKKHKGLRKISDRQRKRLKNYAFLALVYASVHPKCEFNGCQLSATDIHHKAGRGKNLLNIDTFCALCRFHHQFVHDNPKQAREMGLLK